MMHICAQRIIEITDTGRVRAGSEQVNQGQPVRDGACLLRADALRELAAEAEYLAYPLPVRRPRRQHQLPRRGIAVRHASASNNERYQ